MHCRHPFETSNPNAVLTGATSGIGRVAAGALVQRGFALTMLARNLEAAHQLARELRTTTPRADVRVVHCDLSRLAEVSRCAQALRRALPHIHLLVHNAGRCSQSRTLGPDGREHTWTVNQLSPFLLTEILLPSLLATQDPQSPSRIVTVASQAHHRGRLYLDDPHALARGYHGYRQYAASKLANLMWTRVLDERYRDQGVRAYAYHPGVVNTNIAEHMGGAFGLFFRIARPLLRTPAQGAHTLITLACNPRIPETPYRYFIDDQPASISSYAQSDARARALWRVCAQECALVRPCADPTTTA